MSDNFITPDTRRFLWQLRFLFGVMGSVLLLLGIIRLSAEMISLLGDYAETIIPSLFSTETLVLAVLYSLVGYGAIYAWAAVGAAEPPALSAIRLSLFSLVIVLWATVITGLLNRVLIGIVMTPGAIAFSLLIGWMGIQTERRSLWQVFGQPINRSRRRGWLILFASSLGLIILVSLGAIYVVLNDTFELFSNNAEAGNLLYMTTFDDYNDEWDLPKGIQEANIIEGELVLTEASGLPANNFYARLEDRRFANFDLRVTTRQIEGENDNTYGVIFRWRDVENLMRFEISGDGYYRLSQTEDNNTQSITQWIPSDAINQGTAQNQIRIVAQDNQFQFYVNAQLMPLCTKGENREPLVNPLTGECVSNDWQDTYTDDTFAQGRIGLTVGTTRTTEDLATPIVIGFDNLILLGTD